MTDEDFSKLQIAQPNAPCLLSLASQISHYPTNCQAFDNLLSPPGGRKRGLKLTATLLQFAFLPFSRIVLWNGKCYDKMIRDPILFEFLHCNLCHCLLVPKITFHPFLSVPRLHNSSPRPLNYERPCTVGRQTSRPGGFLYLGTVAFLCQSNSDRM